MSSAPDSAVGNWLSELERLASRDRDGSPREQLLRVAAEGVGASGGALWAIDAAGQLRLEAQLGLGDEPIDRLHEAWSGHAGMLRAVIESGRPQAVHASLNTQPGGNGAQPSAPQPLKVLAGPVYDAHARPDGVIELFLAADAVEGGEQSALLTLHEFCHRAAALPRGIAPAMGQGQGQGGGVDFDQFAQACRRLHGSLDVETTAVAVANEARAWIGCDRVSVFGTRGRRCRLWAVSDQDAIDHRSRAVRALQALAESAVHRGEAVWNDGGGADTSSPEAGREDALAAVARRRVAAVPMRREGDAGALIGVLVAEDFADGAAWSPDARGRIELFARQGALALGNAQAHHTLPLSGLGRVLERMGWRSPFRFLTRWGVAAAVCAAVAAWLALYPADFRITGRGELQPASQRDVFARVRGVVDVLHVAHGDPVSLNAPLVTLRSPDLEQERTRLEGELRTTTQQLTDLAILRAGARSFESEQTGSVQLAAREQELTAVRDGLQRQLAALERYESELALTSPLAGRVLTSNVEELLAGRPVEPGQRLLTVADIDGPWVVRIHVPDRDVRHVTDALERPGPLDVTFVTATDVETQHRGRVTDVARAVEYDPHDGPVVVVTAEVERTEALDPRPGATVYPYIDCGRRPIGYVWFRRLIDSTRSWLAL